MPKYSEDEFFLIDVSTLRAGAPLPCNVYVHLMLNGRAVVYKRNGDTVDEDMIAKLQTLGVSKLYISSSEREAYDAYLKAPPTPAEVRQKEEKYDPTEMLEAIKTESNASKEKEEGESVKPPARSPEAMLASLASEDEIERKKAKQEAKETVRDLIPKTADASSTDPDFEMIDNDSDEHSTNVAMYTVLFAMGLGKTDKTLLSDLTMAALVHDIGVTQLMNDIVQMPENKRTPAMHSHYARHIPLGLGLLDEIGFKVNSRVRTIFEQHHEKFNGSGYPKGLDSFKIDEDAQLVGMADLLDNLCSGRFDGTHRNLKEGVEKIREIEKQKNFPEYFNPDLFKKVLDWFTKHCGGDASDKATKVVTETLQKVI